MTKKSSQNKSKNIFVFLFVIFGVFFVTTYYLKNNSITKKDSFESETKEFNSSEIMDFTVNIPSSFTVDERFGSAKLMGDGGEIFIEKIGSDYSDIKKHLSDSRINILTKMIEIQESKINGYDSISGRIEGEKVYFILTDFVVYTLSTSNTNLYSTLDQIAQSFRYTPN